MDATHSLATTLPAGPVGTEERTLMLLLAVLPQVRIIKACIDGDPSAVQDMQIVVNDTADDSVRHDAERRFKDSDLFKTLIPLMKKLQLSRDSDVDVSDPDAIEQVGNKRARFDRKDRNSRPCTECRRSKLKVNDKALQYLTNFDSPRMLVPKIRKRRRMPTMQEQTP